MSNNREDEGRPEIRINKKMRTWNKYRNYCFIANWCDSGYSCGIYRC